MRISKEAAVRSAESVSPENLEKINAFARKKLSEEEVFTFSVILCDNEIDRDGECFPEESLNALAELFVGKTGICDHNWSSSGQVARIYDACVEKDDSRYTSYGNIYAFVKAKAYMLRTDGNAELIAQIQGGIKKEVSVGCAVAESICSICGMPMGAEECGHIKGAAYNGQVCYAQLINPTDAYEWSFVAVPAQRNAGVSKGLSTGCTTLKELAEKHGGEIQRELEELLSMAELGRSYYREVQKDVMRLGMLTGLFSADGISKAILKLDCGELTALRCALEKKADELLPPETQLMGFKKEDHHAPETEYMI